MHFTNHVFVCLNDKYLKVFSGYLTTQAISNPVRIYDSNENKRAINEGIKKYGLELNNLQFKNVLMSGYKEQIQVHNRVQLYGWQYCFWLFV